MGASKLRGRYNYLDMHFRLSCNMQAYLGESLNLSERRRLVRSEAMRTGVYREDLANDLS